MTTNDVRLVRTTQIRIFPADVLPHAALLSPAGIAAIKETFDLSLPPMPPEILGSGLLQSAIPLQGGLFKMGGRAYPIHKLHLESRRIVTEIEAPSDVSDHFFSEFSALMRRMDPRDGDRPYTPVVTSDDTTCVTRLGFSMRDLFADLLDRGLGRIISDAVPSYGARLEVFPKSLKLRIAYRDPPDAIARGQVTLLQKDFVVEIRDQTAPEDCVFFTESPSRSEVHMQILKRIEELVAGGRG